MNNNKKYNPQETYEILKQVFEIIVNQNKYHIKNTRKSIDLDTKKKLYEGFYVAFNLLIELPDLPSDIKEKLIFKKNLVDMKYAENIKNKNLIHKNNANKILEATTKLNNQAQKLSELDALKLKAQITELNKTEKNRLNELLQKNTLGSIAANLQKLNFKKSS